MSDDLADLARRCTEVRILHHPRVASASTDVPFQPERFVVLARGLWDQHTMRGEGQTIEEAVRNLHDE